MPKGTVSPRRLSRARQPPPSAPSHTNSSSSSSSNRAERNTRSHIKASSPQKSSTPQSLTSEETGGPARAATSEPPQLRRSRRQHEADDEIDTKIEDAGDDELIEDEEVTRCICGQQEYPGPPELPKKGEEVDLERGGLFIQCDKCQVWQHGGCVSIFEEPADSDNYYCEECKPEYHDFHKGVNGRRYSRYLPEWQKTHPKNVRKGSVDKEVKTKVSKERERLASALPESKRRATMNSRSTYDEEEVLRKVLEESKAEVGTEDGSRKGKRGRDESEDVRSDIKRQRTASSAITSRSNSDSDTDMPLKQLPRNAAPKAQPSKGQKDSNRKDRAGRRRGEGSELPDEAPAASKTSRKASPVEAGIPDTSNANTAPAAKRGGKKPGNGRGKHSSSQQAGHDRGSPRAADGEKDTPLLSSAPNGTTAHRKSKRGQATHTSDDSDKDNTQNNSNGAPHASDAEAKDSSGAERTSGGNGKKNRDPSMNELKRRAAAMLDWIEKARDEYGRNAALSLVPNMATGGVVGKSEMEGVAEMLHSRLLGWQVEYGAG